MKYIDMHCDTLAEGLRLGKQTVTEIKETMVDVNRLQKADAMAQVFAMFVPQKQYHKKNQEWFGVPEEVEEEELLELLYQVYINTIKENENRMAAARSYEELMDNDRNGKISAFLSLENGYVVKGDLQKLQRVYDMGVRLITLTWNDPNCFGFPHSKEAALMKQGLTPFGKEAISYMNELGILIDVSHLSDGGFYDVARCSSKPFVASHSNCRALCEVSRNLSDDMIRLLAEKGGVAGINLEPYFLDPNHDAPRGSVELLCDHIEHFLQIGGSECVAIGTDFDGMVGTNQICDCSQMQQLFEALQKRKIPGNTIDKIAHLNVERVIKDTMK